MKTRIPLLIAAGLIISTITKAQFGPACQDNRVVVKAHFGFPVPVPVINHYEYYPVARERYDDRRDGDYGRYDDRRDWRAEQYERYCHETRGRRISREEFYRDHCDPRNNSYYAPRKVVEYRRY